MKKEDFLNKWIDALPINSKDNDRKEMEYDLIQLLKNKTKEDWVSVKDRLPELENTYIVLRGGYVELADFIIDRGQNFWYDYIGITHWQPLPQPPVTE